MDGNPLNSLTFSIFNLDRSSYSQVHPRTVRRGGGHWLQCDPSMPCRRLPWTTGHLEERGWTSTFPEAPCTWHYYTEQGKSTYHQWVFLVGYVHRHYTCENLRFTPKCPVSSQVCGWRMRQYISVRLTITLARSRPRPESLWLDWVREITFKKQFDSLTLTLLLSLPLCLLTFK